MAQFDVYRNVNPATRARIPYLLDLQSDLLDPRGRIPPRQTPKIRVLPEA